MTVKLEAVHMVCLHPANNTYAMFTVVLSFLENAVMIGGGEKELILSVKNLQIFDNTQFPETLDPEVAYYVE